MKKTLSPIFWLWIPVVAMIIQIILEIFGSEHVLATMHNENGTHEILQAVIMIGAFFYAAYCVINSKISRNLVLKSWFALAAICCFYVAGEEVSWGQHIWNWATPELWAQANDQQETNLHNTSSWFDQKPRLILIVGIVVGTLIMPFLKNKNIFKLPNTLDVLLPAAQLKVMALFVIIPQLIEKLFEVFDIKIFTRFSEVQELYIFYFVLIYLIILSIDVRAKKEAL